MRKFIIISLIVILAIFGIGIFFLTRNIDRILVNKIAEAVGGEVNLEEFHFNPFTGFRLEGFNLTFPGDSIPQSVSEIRFSYSLPALFKRQFLITGVTIVSPRFHLQQRADGAWNIPTPALKKSTGRTTPPDTIQKSSLPVKIRLNKLNIKDLKGELITQAGSLTVNSGNLEADGLHFNSTEDFYAEIIIRSLSARADLNDNRVELSINLSSEASVSDSGGDCVLSGSVEELSRKFGEIPPLNFRFGGRVNLPSQTAVLDTIELRLKDGEEIAVSGGGLFQGWENKSDFHLLFHLNSLRLDGTGWISSIMKEYIPEKPEFHFELNEHSSLELKGAYKIPDRELKVDCSLKHSSAIQALTYGDGIVKVEKGAVDISAELDYAGDALALKSLEFNTVLENPEITLPKLPHLNLDSLRSTVSLQGEKAFCALQAHGFEGASVECGAVVKNIPDNLLAANLNLEMLDSVWTNLSSINPSHFGIYDIVGSLKAGFSLVNRGEFLSLSGNIRPQDTLCWLSEDKRIHLPVNPIEFEGSLKVSQDYADFAVKNIDITVSDWLYAGMSAEFPRGEDIAVDIDDLKIDLEALRKHETMADFLPLKADALIEASGGLKFPPGDLKRITGNITTAVEPFDYSAVSVNARRISIDLEAGIEGNMANISADIKVASIELPELNRAPIENIEVSVMGEGDISAKYIFSFSTDAILPGEGFALNASGNAALPEGIPEIKLQFKTEFSDTSGIEIMPGILSKGYLNSILRVACDSILTIEGEFTFEDFSLRTPQIEITGVGGRVPLKQTVFLSPLNLRREIYQEHPFYLESRPYRAANSSQVENFAADRVKLFGREMTDISADLFWKEGYLALPHFQLSLFEGNLSGRGWLRVDSLTDAKITYEISARGAEINSDLISQFRTRGGEASKIGFIYNFRGDGFDPSDPDFNIEGALHITRISPKVAENLLLALDPQQRDKGIQSTLYFLKRGWGIRSFSFELAHGFVYSTIITQQPPPKKPLPFIVSRILPLEKEIRLSRLPLRFFLK